VADGQSSTPCPVSFSWRLQVCSALNKITLRPQSTTVKSVIYRVVLIKQESLGRTLRNGFGQARSLSEYTDWVQGLWVGVCVWFNLLQLQCGFYYKLFLFDKNLLLIATVGLSWEVIPSPSLSSWIQPSNDTTSSFQYLQRRGCSLNPMCTQQTDMRS